MGCTERTVIFDLRFHKEVGDEDPVIMGDDVIGRRLRWEGVTRAMALVNKEDGGRSSPSRERGPASEDGDTILLSLRPTAGGFYDDTVCWAVKGKVDWTLASIKIQAKRQRGDE